MGFAFAYSQCFGCGAMFSYNPVRVPAIRHDGVRKPICASCVAIVNPLREKNGLALIVPAPDAYEPVDEFEL